MKLKKVKKKIIIQQFKAITKVAINWTKAIGAQILSILLGVTAFNIVEIKKNTTTNHIAIFEISNKVGKNNPLQETIIIPKKIKSKIFKTANNLILGGYFPGNLPPHWSGSQWQAYRKT